MSKVVPLAAARRARKEVQRQAAEWLAEVHAGLSDDQREQLQKWLAQEPSHVEAFVELARWWDEFSVLSALSDVFPLDEKSGAPTRHRRWRKVSAVAALAAGVAMAAIVALYLYAPGGDAPPGPAPFVYSTDIGERADVALPDGSEVMLNTDTTIEVDYSVDERKVHLQRGEGHFNVAAERDGRPFRVDVDGRLIEATGTGFAVYRFGRGGVQVTVTEGTVNISGRHEGALPWLAPSPPPAGSQAMPLPESRSAEPSSEWTAALSAGEQASIGDGVSEDIVVQQLSYEEIEAQLAWRHGRLLFQGDPLHEVVGEVSRYTQTELIVDPAIGDRPVTGYYRAGDVDRLLVALEQNFGVRVQYASDEEIHLLPQ